MPELASTLALFFIIVGGFNMAMAISSVCGVLYAVENEDSLELSDRHETRFFFYKVDMIIVF